MYRFHQLLTATHNPARVNNVMTPSAAMLGGIHMEACVAELLGFQPWLPDDVEFTSDDREKYREQAVRAAAAINDFGPMIYQPTLPWPSKDDAMAEGHPDFMAIHCHHVIDLKTTEYPTDEMLDKLLHSVQMCAYMAAYKRSQSMYPELSIVLASRLVAPEPVKFNKDGSVSLSGQNADHASLAEAVELMGEKADDRHWNLVFKAPVWAPVLSGTLSCEECELLAKVGEIFLDAGLAILDTGLADMVHRPYA